MQNFSRRAHLPAVPFSPRSYMGCGGWDLEHAPKTVAASLEERPALASRRPLAQQRSPRVTMGCGDEMCQGCKANQGLGCPKCKRIRKNAMNQELEGRQLGQAPAIPDTSSFIVAGLVVTGLFYFATR